MFKLSRHKLNIFSAPYETKRTRERARDFLIEQIQAENHVTLYSVRQSSMDLKHPFYYSVSYSNGHVYLSVAEFPHTIDFENKTLKPQHVERILSITERDLLANGQTEDVRQIWTIKESLIKYNDLRLFDLMNTKELIEYQIKNGEIQKINWNDQTFYVKSNTFKNQYYCVLAKHQIPPITIKKVNEKGEW